MSKKDLLGAAILAGVLDGLQDSRKSEGDFPPVQHKDIESLAKVLRGNKGFVVGQLVTQTEGLDYYKRPRVGQPAIITEIAEMPKYATNDLGESGPYHQKIMDIRIGVIDENDGCFMQFWVSSRPFIPFDQEHDHGSAREIAQELKIAHTHLLNKHRFNPGQPVRVKRRFNNRKFPRKQDVAVFMEYITPCTSPEDGHSGQHFGDTYDCIIAVGTPKGVLEFTIPSCYLEPAQ